MPVREQGLRRVAAVTTGLAVAGVVGSVAVATIARADTQSAKAGTSSTSTPTAGTPDDSPSLSGSTGQQPHATSGGS